MSDNKPCPFCGDTCVSCQLDGSQGIKWGAAVCGNCGAQGPEVRTGYDTSESAPWHEQALKEWNNRNE